MSARPKNEGIPSRRPRPRTLVDFLFGPLTDAEGERLRKTGRWIYGKPPYSRTEEERKQWEEARTSRKETH